MKNRPLGENVKTFLAALDSAGCPKDALCHHLGTGFGQGLFMVGIGMRTRGTTLVTCYGSVTTFGKRVFDHIREQLRDIAPIVEAWNGEQGQTGISIVLGREAPESMATGIANYFALENVFDNSPVTRGRYAAFHNFEQKALRRAGWVQPEAWTVLEYDPAPMELSAVRGARIPFLYRELGNSRRKVLYVSDRRKAEAEKLIAGVA